MIKETPSNVWNRASHAFTVQNMPASSLLIRLVGYQLFLKINEEESML